MTLAVGICEDRETFELTRTLGAVHTQEVLMKVDVHLSHLKHNFKISLEELQLTLL